MARRYQRSRSRNRSRSRTTYGKPFRKKSSRGKFKKGTWIKYAYKNGRRIGAVRSRK